MDCHWERPPLEMNGIDNPGMVVPDRQGKGKFDESASGMKYSDGTWTFFGKGPEALVMKNDEHVLTECKAAGHP